MASSKSWLVREMCADDCRPTSGLIETLKPLGVVPSEERLLRIYFWSRDLHIVRLVAVDRSTCRIIGTASIFLERKFIHSGGLVGHIEDVSVAVEHQGKGIGKDLVNVLVERAKKLEAYKVLLDCNEDNVPFYEKLGFKKHEHSMRIDL